MKTINFTGVINLNASAPGQYPRFSIHAYTGDELKVNGFEYPVIVELESASFETEQIYINRHHDQKRELGHANASESTIDVTGIYIVGAFSHDNNDTREIIEANKRGKQFKASIEANVTNPELFKNGSVFVNGRSFPAPCYVARNAVITGCAILTRAADMKSKVLIQAKRKKNMPSELETFIVASGFDFETVSENEKQLQTLTAQFEATQKTDSDESEGDDWAHMLKKQREIAAGESKRQTGIRRICKQFGDPEIEGPKGETISLECHAIDKGWSTKETELEAKLWDLENRGGEFQSPAFHDATTRKNNRDVIECSLAMSAGLTEQEITKNKFYPEDIVTEAMSETNRGYRVSRLAHDTIRAAGMHYPAGKIDDGFLRRSVEAEHKLRAAGFSTVSIPGILRDAMNKVMLSAYRRSASLVPVCFGQTSASDFKPSYSYQLEGSGKLEHVGQDGEIKHGQIVESEYTKKLQTYAKMLSFTRQMFISDDMNSLAGASSMLGIMAYKAREYAAVQMIANTAIFSTDNGNLLTGNTLGIDGLTESGKAFDGQTDSDGLPISIDGNIVLAPASLKVITSQLQNDLEIRDTNANRKSFISNPHAGSFSGFNTPWLDNELATAVDGVADPDRSKTWYVLSDPRLVAAFEVVYLNGQDSPTIETSSVAFDQLGMQFRAYYDFGFGETDPKYAQKNVGA